MRASYDEHAGATWRGKASAYQHSFGTLCAFPVPVLLDALAVGGSTRVLDAGRGSGAVTDAATARGAVVTAVDAEPSMVRATTERVPGVQAAVAELARVARPGGRVGATIWPRLSPR